MYSQLQSWPTPEIYINPHKLVSGASLVTYDAPTCREDIIFTIPSLQTNAVYELQIASTSTGAWFTHIYFALQTPAEQSSFVKVLRLNNDYNGASWFRIRRIATTLGPETTVLTTAVNPLASVIAPPTISLAGLTDLTGESDPPSRFYAMGLRPLGAYMDGTFVRPLSVVEDRVVWNDSRYCRVSKIYGGWHQETPGLGVGDLGGTLVTDVPTPTIDNTVTVTPPGGATATWTRDGSDPAVDTVLPFLQGIVGNAYIHDNAFKGLIRARAFNGSCRSPLVIASAAKVMADERAYVTLKLYGSFKTSYCDLTRSGSESGYSCLNNFGGVSQFDAALSSQAEAAPTLENGTRVTFVADANGVQLYSVQNTNVETPDYLGWTNHIRTSAEFSFAHFPDPSETSLDQGPSGYYQHTGFVWHRTNNNGWQLFAPQHNWPVWETNTPSAPSPRVRKLGISDLFVEASIGGTLDSTAFEFVMSASLREDCITNSCLQFQSLVTPPNKAPFYLTQWNLIQSPLSYGNSRDTYWGPIIHTLLVGAPAIPIPTPANVPPAPDPNLLLNIEPWDEYAVSTNADAGTYNKGDLAVFSSSQWVITTYAIVDGAEYFESYSIGDAITDSFGAAVSLNGGDGFSGPWVIVTEDVTSIDDFEGYTTINVDMDSFNYNKGTNWTTLWVVWPPQGAGLDNFESYSVGVISSNLVGGQNMDTVGWHVF